MGENEATEAAGTEEEFVDLPDEEAITVAQYLPARHLVERIRKHLNEALSPSYGGEVKMGPYELHCLVGFFDDVATQLRLMVGEWPTKKQEVPF